MISVEMPLNYCSTLCNAGDGLAETNEDRLLCTLRSILEIEKAIARWKIVESNASATIAERLGARQRIAYAEREFGGQWRNVQELLKSFAPKESKFYELTQGEI